MTGSSINGWKWELALVMITALWGWSFVAIHDALASMNSATFTALRFLVAAAVMALILFPSLKDMSRRELTGGVAAGLALFAAVALQTEGLRFTSPSNASFITGLAVIFTLPITFFFLGIHPSVQQVLGALIATLGLAFLTAQDFSIRFGDLLVLGCALSFASHIVILSRASKGTHSGRITLVQLVVVGLLGLVWSLGFGEFSMPASSETWVAVLVVGVAGTALGFYVQTKAQIQSPPSRIALILVLEPVFGGLFGYWLAGDRLTPLNLFGAALILVGILATEIRIRRLVRAG
ncbi:EamA-like transporter family protein [compost metagenome]